MKMKIQNEKKAQFPQSFVPAKGQYRALLVRCLIAIPLIIWCTSSILQSSRLYEFLYRPSDHHALSNCTEQAHAILSKNPLIDGHVDLAIFIRGLYKNRIYTSDFQERFENGGMKAQVDLPRLEAGQYGGAFWSAFYLCQKDIFDFSDESYAPIVRATLEQLDLYQRLRLLYPRYFTPPVNASSALSRFRSSSRTLISPLAIEGLHQIGNSLSTLRLYHSLGVRYATLTWNCHNLYADAAVLTFMNNGSSVKSEPYWGGVSLRGRTLIHEMNRLGMLVDLAHVSFDTMRDVLVGDHNYNAPHSHKTNASSNSWSGSIAPPIFSHSSAYAVCPHPRNVPDDILALVKQRNSVVMINFSPGFVSCTANNTTTSGIPDFYAANNTLAHVADHIMHIGNLIGFAYIGIGSDFDGIEGTPKGLEDVTKVVDLVAELLRRGVIEKDIIGIIGGNILRVWGEVDRVAEEMKSRGVLPAEDEFENPWL